MSNYWTPSGDKHGQKHVPGAELPIRKGYGVRYISETDPSTNNYTAKLTDQFNREIYFWIEDMDITININGSTGQSRSVRQFFPHNLSQPSITIRGRHADSYRRNLFAIFVRESQYNALSSRYYSQDDADFDPLIELSINGRKSDEDLRGEANPGSNTARKGRPHQWVAKGYIKNIQAGAKRFDPAPTFEFEFLVAEMVTGPGRLEDGSWKPKEMTDFMTLFAARPRNEFQEITKPTKPPKPPKPTEGRGPLRETPSTGLWGTPTAPNL